jgi:hypothetical protein
MVAYRFDPDYTITGRHYAHPLIQWSTIFAGAVAAIAVGFLLNMLGLAIGASAFNPYEINTQDETISIGGGLYVMFAQLVAFQVGAYIAARGSRYPDHFGGLLTGFLVWALAVAFAVSLATFAAGALSSGDALTSGVAETIGELSDATDGRECCRSRYGRRHRRCARRSLVVDGRFAFAWPCRRRRRRLARLTSSEVGNASASRRHERLPTRAEDLRRVHRGRDGKRLHSLGHRHPAADYYSAVSVWSAELTYGASLVIICKSDASTVSPPMCLMNAALIFGLSAIKRVGWP